ncbi:MAG: molybdenum cofactor biosynthesis protein MoaE [Gammaproteobacteria bacterium]|nr:molybdenum cofactor biosynthesis protein MoaE [Gammaproteobacteria bacterium]
MSYSIDIFDKEFEPYEILSSRQKINNDVGAQSIFIGYMRDFRDDSNVQRMTITHYPPMTERYIEQLILDAIKKYHLIDVYIAHRVGDVKPTSALVIISVLASHRANALQATETLLEELKHKVPLWKKEYTKESSSGTWVDKNTSNSIQTKKT